MMDRSNFWTNVRFLVGHEFKGGGWWLAGSGAMNVIFALIASILPYQEYFSAQSGLAVDQVVSDMFVTDLFYLMIMSSIGFALFSREYRSNWVKTRPITRKLTYLKGLPISSNEIAASRSILYLITLGLLGSVFFVALYLFSPFFHSEIGLGLYISFALVWLGYALAVGGTFLIAEQTMSEKAYFILSFLFIGIFTAIAVLLRVTGFPLVKNVLAWVQQYGVIVSFLSVIIGLIVLLLSTKVIAHRLNKRELLG